MSEKTWQDTLFIRMREDHLRNDDEEEEEPLDFSEQEEIKERLYEFLTKYREEKETNKKLLEEGEMMERKMKELEEDNKSLTINLENLNKNRKKWKKKEEKTLQHEQEEERKREQKEKCEDERVKIKEKENKNLWEENENIIHKVQHQRMNSRLNDELEVIKEVLHVKAEEIEKLFRVLAHKHEEEGEHKMFIEEFRKEIRGIKKHLSDIQEVQILEALTVQNPRDKTKKDEQKKERDEKKEKDKKDGKTQRSWWRPIAKFLWKGTILAGIISVGTVLVVNIMASNVPDSSSKVQIPWHLLRHNNSGPFLF